MIKEMLFDKVLIEPYQNEGKSESGLDMIVADNERPITGTVIKKGHTTEKVQEGDTVMIPSLEGTKITKEEKNYIIIEERKIFAIL